jgi:hypothetical protein
MSDIQLNFINNSNDANQSRIVIFQGPDVLPGADAAEQVATVWTVLPDLAAGEKHSFTFPPGMMAVAEDFRGQVTQQLPVSGGETIEAVKTGAAISLVELSKDSDDDTIILLNKTGEEIIFTIFRNDAIVSRNELEAEQEMTFSPTVLSVGFSKTPVRAGDEIEPGALHASITLSLQDVAGADIVLHGSVEAGMEFVVENERVRGAAQ